MKLRSHLFATLISAVMLASAFSIFVPVHAAGTPTVTSPSDTSAKASSDNNCHEPGGQTIANPLKACSLMGVLTIVLNAAIQLGIIVLTLALMWTGFKFIEARGAPEKISTARTQLLWTLIGGLILLGAKAIEVVIESTVKNL